MNRRTALFLFAAITLAGPVVAVSAAASPPVVSVRYDHPENFTEAREVRTFARSRADASAYLQPLRQYIERTAPRSLEPGQRLDIVITDVDRAGSYLPTATAPQPVRVVSDLYPPRINLRFRLLNGAGAVLRQGDRRLIGLGFMQDTPGVGSQTDPLRFEKHLIDRWLRRGADRL